jgi:hypothetical protein
LIVRGLGSSGAPDLLPAQIHALPEDFMKLKMTKNAIGPDFRVFAEETIDVSVERAIDFMADGAAEMVDSPPAGFLEKVEKARTVRAADVDAKKAKG